MILDLAKNKSRARGLLESITLHLAILLTLNSSALQAQSTSYEISNLEDLKKLNSDQISSIQANDECAKLRLKNNDVLLTTRILLTDYLRYVMKVSGYKKEYDQTFTKLETEAAFPGGKDAWQAYVNKNLRFPSGAVEEEIQGTVVVSVIVDIDGTIHAAEAVSGPSKLKQQAVEFVKSSGKWLPGIQNKMLEKSYKKIPVTFRLPG